MVSDERISTLVELGLSPSQARVYLLMVESGILTAQSISKISGIVRSDVYRLLGELGKDGLVQKIISAPGKFQAMPVEESILILLQRKVKKTEQLQEKALSLVHSLKGLTAQDYSDDPFRFILISGKDAVHAKIERMMRNTKESFWVLASARRLLAWLPFGSNSLDDAVARKVDCRMIVPKKDEDLLSPLRELEKRKNVSIRLSSEQPETSFSIWDQKEVILSTSIDASLAQTPVLLSNNQSLVMLCKRHFEYLWFHAQKRAKPLSK